MNVKKWYVLKAEICISLNTPEESIKIISDLCKTLNSRWGVFSLYRRGRKVNLDLIEEVKKVKKIESRLSEVRRSCKYGNSRPAYFYQLCCYADVPFYPAYTKCPVNCKLYKRGNLKEIEEDTDNIPCLVGFAPETLPYLKEEK
jgi:hypothetical protein